MNTITSPSSKLTLEDIARLCGISRSTVSRVVNNHPNVSEPIRQRVLKIIQETGYHPNEAARTLASQRSWMLGLVMPRSVSTFFNDPYYSRLTQGIAQACNQYNYTLSFFLISTTEDEEKIYPRISRKGLLDGIVLQAGQFGDHLADRLVKSDMPIIMAGRPFHTENVSYIDIDNVAAAYNAVSHLIRQGYQRIATITGSSQHTAGIDRLEGYKKALLDRGRTVDETLIVEGDFAEDSGYYGMQKLLAGSRPDAVFAASDVMAAGAMRAAREAGLRIPDDVAFIGFDDALPAGLRVTPQLTTVRQPIIPFGIKAVEILIDMIENGIQPVRRVIMGTELIIRESCGAIRQ